MAWTFGRGHYLINSRLADPRFGLISVLNRLCNSEETDDEQPPSHRRVGVTRAVVNARSGRLKKAELIAAEPTRADRLGRIDTTTDSLASVTGHSKAGPFSHLSGGRSLKEDAVVSSLTELQRLSAEAISAFGETRYQQDYRWIDRNVPEEDERVIDRVLEAVWNGEAPDGRHVPVDIVWGDQIPESDENGPVDHFRYSGERRLATKEFRTNLTWSAVRRALLPAADSGVPRSQLLQESLRFFDAEDVELGSCGIVELLTAELSLDGQTYVLADGTVWRVDQAFVDAVSDDLRAFIIPTHLPPYSGGSEEKYNLSVVSDPSWTKRAVCLDRCFIRLPREGQYPVEACDLISADRTLFHIKLKGRSSTLSHLCEQAVVSARLLRRDAAARGQLQEYIIERGDDPRLIDLLVDRVDELAQSNHGWNVAFAVVGGWQRVSISALPLFARIALREACQQLTDFGFNPRIELVGT